MSSIKFIHAYDSIISLENILEAWKEFVGGKKNRKDVQEFGRNLMPNIFELHRELSARTYRHSPYFAFKISDPKPRNIHKANVRDRLLHHAIYRQLYPFFDRIFIADSFSCRVGKGTHKALERFKSFSHKVSQNHTETAWVLKCDIRKFFASIDQEILLKILEKYISDKEIILLLRQLISSFSSTEKGKGLPLGNLTSQLFVNIYMNEFDQFVKHRLKAKYYIRYADDFVIFSRDKEWLKAVLLEIQKFLSERLSLSLHPHKISLETMASGLDFLGWVNFPHHRVMRTTTRKRMFKNIQKKKGKTATVQSYLGLLKHGDSHEITQKIKKDHYSKV